MDSFDRVECRVARDPRGPWGKPEVIFNRLDPAAAADNGPGANPVWVGLDHADKNVKRKTVTYAPYQVPAGRASIDRRGP